MSPSPDPERRVPCSTCRPGEPCDQHCGSALRQTPGGLCKQPKGKGTDHVGIGSCDRHGGATRNHRVAANVEKARRAVAAFALPVESDPHSALLDALYRRVGMVTYLAKVIGDMESDADLKQLSIGAGAEKFERPAVWVEMYDSALKEQAKVAKACIDAGIDERRIALAEEHGRALDGVLRGVLADVFAVLSRALAEALGGGAPALLDGIMRNEVPAIVRRRVMVLVASTTGAA